MVRSLCRVTGKRNSLRTKCSKHRFRQWTLIFFVFSLSVCENVINMITRYRRTTIANRFSALSLWFSTLFVIFGTRNYADGQAQPVHTQEQLPGTQPTAPWYETLPAVAMDYKVIIDPGKEDCYFQFVNPGATFYASAQVHQQRCAPLPKFFID